MRCASAPKLSRHAALAGLALAGLACASVPAAKPDPDPAYPGRCSFVELQASPKPSPGRGSGPDNLGTGTVELVATYRPGGGAERRPVSYAFRVQQERADDLRAHLEQQPEILCEGESADDAASTGADTNPAGPQAPSFEGQQGRRLPSEPAPTPTGTE